MPKNKARAARRKRKDSPPVALLLLKRVDGYVLDLEGCNDPAHPHTISGSLKPGSEALLYLGRGEGSARVTVTGVGMEGDTLVIHADDERF